MVEMSKAVRSRFITSLRRSLGRPQGRGEFASSPYKMFFGIRLSSCLTTWPIHRKRRLLSKVDMSVVPVIDNTAVFGTRSRHTQDGTHAAKVKRVQSFLLVSVCSPGFRAV